ncbi:MAG: HEAT repeat domain-containing protein, partial [Gammaproteobacteria bacterium]|nr:HEAT repeat domain-containing protein [Gammaproteobacteria bacterium]
AEHKKLGCATHHLALSGFTPRHIKRYVTQFCQGFGRESMTASLTTWVMQPQLRELAGVPLQLELLCSLGLKEPAFLQTEGDIPLTLLYAKLFITLGKRFLKKQSSYLNLGERARGLTEQEVLLRVQEPLAWLAELALEGMLAQQTQVSVTQLPPEHPLKHILAMLPFADRELKLTAALEHFGLLSPIDLIETDRQTQRYTFGHLTYQEFLAAWALAKRLMMGAPEERLAIIKRIQGSFYYRMQIFLVSLLSEPRAFSVFFTFKDEHQRQATLYYLFAQGQQLWLADVAQIVIKLIHQDTFRPSLSFLHACRLLDVALGGPLDKKNSWDDLKQSRVKSFLPFLDACFTERAIFSYVFYRWFFLSRRLLEMPSIKCFLEDRWRQQPRQLILWMGSLGGLLPGFLERKIDEASQSTATDLRQAAAETIGMLGEYTSEGLKVRLKTLSHDAEPEVREAVAQSIGWLGKSASVALKIRLEQLSYDVQSQVRQTAARAIGILGKQASERLKARLEMLSHDPDSKVRENAALGIGGLGRYANKMLQLKLIELLKDRDPNVRVRAKWAIIEINKHASEALQAHLVALLGDNNSAVRQAAKVAINCLGNHATETTKSALAQVEAVTGFDSGEGTMGKNVEAWANLKEKSNDIVTTIQLSDQATVEDVITHDAVILSDISISVDLNSNLFGVKKERDSVTRDSSKNIIYETVGIP